MKQKKRFYLLLTAAIAVLTFSCNQQEGKIETIEKTNTAGESINQLQQKPTDKTALAGNWIRTDGGYKLQISELYDDGKMKAGYFNPKSINVGQAQWTRDGGILKIFIELRDLNYPGSRYNLSYMQGRDMLAGEYFQAVERTTYKVEFERAK